MTRLAQIEALQIELLSHPKSMSFTQLADLYIAENMIDEAENLLLRSLKFHPTSISGRMLLGRIYQMTERLIESLQQFDFCVQKAPDNWMCTLLRAQSHLKLNQYHKALADFKKVVLLNPQNQTANRAIAKIDSLSLTMEEDVDQFQSHQLKSHGSHNSTSIQKNKAKTSSLLPKIDPKLERVLSLVDALSSRHEYQRALQLLKECQSEYGQQPHHKNEIEMRMLKLSQYESAQKLRPKNTDSSSMSRRHLIYEKQLNTLNLLLRRILEYKNTQSLV
jgi:tetratricopeptide (TPR) repeat protein